MLTLKNAFIRMAERTLDDLRTDNSNLSDEEMVDIMRLLCHRSMSKDSACGYLNIRRSRFDELIRAGLLPRGRKVRGYKELRWYQDELDEYSRKIKR